MLQVCIYIYIYIYIYWTEGGRWPFLWVERYQVRGACKSAILRIIWGVHESRVDAVKESRGVQLLREWARTHSQEIWPVDGISCILGKSVRHSSPALWGLSGDRWLGFTMAFRIELVLSTGQIAKDVRVLNGLSKTHALRTCYRFTQRKGHLPPSVQYLKLS